MIFELFFVVVIHRQIIEQCRPYLACFFHRVGQMRLDCPPGDAGFNRPDLKVIQGDRVPFFGPSKVEGIFFFTVDIYASCDYNIVAVQRTAAGTMKRQPIPK